RYNFLPQRRTPMNRLLTRYAAATAYLNVIAALLNFVTLMLFFMLEAPQATAVASRGGFSWGTLNDILGALAMLPMLVLALTFYQFGKNLAPRFGLIAFAIGALAM